MKLKLVKPKISSKEFMQCLYAALIKQGVREIKRSDVTPVLYQFKQFSDEYADWFTDFDFRAGVATVSSADVDAAVAWLGMNSFTQLEKDTLKIMLPDDIAEAILEDYDEETIEMMTKITKCFKDKVGTLKRYDVHVVEHRRVCVPVNATDSDKALEEAQRMYDAGEISFEEAEVYDKEFMIN